MKRLLFGLFFLTGCGVNIDSHDTFMISHPSPVIKEHKPAPPPVVITKPKIITKTVKVTTPSTCRFTLPDIGSPPAEEDIADASVSTASQVEERLVRNLSRLRKYSNKSLDAIREAYNKYQIDCPP